MTEVTNLHIFKIVSSFSVRVHENSSVYTIDTAQPIRLSREVVEPR